MAPDLIYLSIAGFFALWVLLSIFNQIQPVSKILSRYDSFSLLPRWTFFAPNPGIHDQYIVFREAPKHLVLRSPESWQEFADDISPWKELTHPTFDGKILYFLWHPTRRATKAISDLTQDLLIKPNESSSDGLLRKLSYGYLVITKIVCSNIDINNQFQWAIARTHGFRNSRSIRVLYISDFHPKGRE